MNHRPSRNNFVFEALFMCIGVGCLSIPVQAQDKDAPIESPEKSTDVQVEEKVEVDSSLIDLDGIFTYPKSHFKNVIGDGKDPFFPESKRRKEQAEEIEISGGQKNFTIDISTSSTRLQGINWSRSNPIALINGVTFSEGETRLIRLYSKDEGDKSILGFFDQQVPIKCIKISKTAVLIKFTDRDEFKVIELPEEIRTH